MTSHSTIIAHVHENFGTFQERWASRFVETGQAGAFVFLPGRDLDWEWWTVSELRDYIQLGGLDDAELLEEVDDLDAEQEFLVLVIEFLCGWENQHAHFHRMAKVSMN